MNDGEESLAVAANDPLFWASALLIGAGATAVMDVWGAARARLFGSPAPNYGLVGRWLAYMPRGRFFHHPISASPSVRHEGLIGWTAHYVTGIGFALILLALYGRDWLAHPTLMPALIVGIGGILAPFLLMQPGMGLGVASSRAPDPAKARLRSLMTHAVFGVGLYAAGWLVHLALP